MISMMLILGIVFPVTVFAGEFDYEPYRTYDYNLLLGDTNVDGTVSEADATNLLNFLYGNPCHFPYMETGDVDFNARIDFNDFRLLERAVTKGDVILGYHCGFFGKEYSNLTRAIVGDGRYIIDGAGEMGPCYDEWGYYNLFKNAVRVLIKNNVTSIGELAFVNCERLVSVTIGNGVTKIEEEAFSGCTNLQTINYLGTAEEWERILIEPGNEYLRAAKINYLGGGNPIPGFYCEIKNNSSCSVIPSNIPAKSRIMYGCYIDDKQVFVDTHEYDGNVVTFAIPEGCDKIKIMAWESFDSLRPICNAKEIVIEQ